MEGIFSTNWEFKVLEKTKDFFKFTENFGLGSDYKIYQTISEKLYVYNEFFE